MRLIAQQGLGSVGLKKIFETMMFLYISLEILLNSFSSVLSHHQFDFEPIFTRKKVLQKRVRHEPTMVKQGLFFLLMTTLNMG